MQTRKLGNSDIHITPVGFGAWALGGGGWQFGWGPQDDNDSIAAIHRSSNSVSLDRHRRRLRPRSLRGSGGPRGPAVEGAASLRLTKCGMRWDKNGRVSKVHSPESIRQECADSLRRLRVDVIDLYQIHWPPEDNGPASRNPGKQWPPCKKKGKSAGLAFPITMLPNFSAVRKSLRHLAPAALLPDSPSD